MPDKYSKIPWDQVVLSAINSRFEVELSEIYDTIYRIAKDGSYIVSQQLFDIEPRWGERPKYYHTVRTVLSSLSDRGMANRVARGRYQITDKGRKRLEELRQIY